MTYLVLRRRIPCIKFMISEIRRNSPVQAIGRLSHSEGAPGIKVKAATWLGIKGGMMKEMRL